MIQKRLFHYEVFFISFADKLVQNHGWLHECNIKEEGANGSSSLFESGTDLLSEILDVLSECYSVFGVMDPFLSWLVKATGDSLVPLMMRIVNASLYEGSLLATLKHGS